MSTLNQRDALAPDAAPARDDEHAVAARVLHLVSPPCDPVDPVAEEHGQKAPELAAVAELERREHIYRQSLAIADGAAALVATLVAAAVAQHAPTLAVLLVPLFAMLVAKIEGLYDRDDQVIRKTNVAEWRTVLQATAITSIGIYLGWRVLTSATAGGGMRLFLFIGLVSFVGSLVFRAVARRAARHLSPDERCVVIGDPHRLFGLAQRLDSAPGVHLVGMVPADALTGSVAELQTIVKELGFHRLVIAPSSEPSDSTLHLVQAAKYIGIRVSLVPSVMTAVGGFATIEELDGTTILGVPRFGLSRSSNALKRMFDIVVGAIALVSLAPVMVTIAVLIKLDSGGPVLFTQTRIGRHGRPFRILKFRSMVPNADAMKEALLAQNEAGAGLFKIAEDPRITRIGRHIRSTHLDELPQLVNVLCGEMSLVGPRPLVAEEDARVTGRDRHRVRLTPGMTGPWQIKGPLHTPLSEMAMLDYRYASAWSIWQDLDILIMTAICIFKRRGH